MCDEIDTNSTELITYKIGMCWYPIKRMILSNLSHDLLDVMWPYKPMSIELDLYTTEANEQVVERSMVEQPLSARHDFFLCGTEMAKKPHRALDDARWSLDHLLVGLSGVVIVQNHLA